MKEQYLVSIRKKDEYPENEYPFTIPSIKIFEKIEFHPKVTFFVGENGSGKSTLLEALAKSFGLNAEGGSRNMNFSTEETTSNLDMYLTVAKGIIRARDSYFLRAESYYNVATHIRELDDDPVMQPKIIDSYGGKSLHHQSHGESFIALLEHRLGGQGIYILDEPEAALSVKRQMTLLSRIHELCEKEASQFVIATHSPILLSYPNAWIYEFSEKGIFRKKKEEVENFTLMEDFMKSPERYLKDLLF